MRSTVMLMTGLTFALLTSAANAQSVAASGSTAGQGGTVQTVSAPATDTAKAVVARHKHEASTKAEKKADKAKEKVVATVDAAKPVEAKAAEVKAEVKAEAKPTTPK